MHFPWHFVSSPEARHEQSKPLALPRVNWTPNSSKSKSCFCKKASLSTILMQGNGFRTPWGLYPAQRVSLMLFSWNIQGSSLYEIEMTEILISTLTLANPRPSVLRILSWCFLMLEPDKYCAGQFSILCSWWNWVRNHDVTSPPPH